MTKLFKAIATSGNNGGTHFSKKSLEEVKQLKGKLPRNCETAGDALHNTFSLVSSRTSVFFENQDEFFECLVAVLEACDLYETVMAKAEQFTVKVEAGYQAAPLQYDFTFSFFDEDNEDEAVEVLPVVSFKEGSNQFKKGVRIEEAA
ncbi:hypothetical protein MTBPR1_140040 [Candidatus Terasakiella magnetica]|uniref:Uncharacterized protein n=1 Tax=Candidatus Terasakiella magnetica TaxID=1867952 RepID=A0A1C3RFB9_9PROT|nr:hypothetical protein [Candidatus Terasakiella magnetica]SCA55922.1 hypothetical protein MTBPR1_140040 [Candidatus Terasakiella magnetica]